MVTSLLHIGVDLSPFDRFVVRQLDGTRDEAAVVEEVLTAIKSGELDLGAEPGGAGGARAAVAEAVARAFQQFRLSGLLLS
jgi:methyltransferase-like protein